MKHGIAAGDRSPEKLRLSQIADHSLRLQIVDIVCPAGWPHQKAQTSPPLGQHMRHVTANKSGRAGNKSFHFQFVICRL